MKTIVNKETGIYATYQDGDWVESNTPDFYPDSTTLDILINHLKKQKVADLDPSKYELITIYIVKKSDLELLLLKAYENNER